VPRVLLDRRSVLSHQQSRDVPSRNASATGDRSRVRRARPLERRNVVYDGTASETEDEDQPRRAALPVVDHTRHGSTGSDKENRVRFSPGVFLSITILLFVNILAFCNGLVTKVEESG
jgi:hypothetical protein